MGNNSLFFVLILSSNEVTFGEYKYFKTSISAITSAIMLLLALSGNGYFYSNIFGIRHIIDWVSSRSYSLYCCHIVSWFMIKQLYSFLGIEYNKNGVIYCIIFMIISAEFTYQYIEKILIKSKSK